jgi:EAL domain-containing protein (putative c-di-GMP-specific phosphodiesterase class I)
LPFGGPLARRVLELYRALAVGRLPGAEAPSGPTDLFVGLHPREIASPGTIAELVRLRDAAGPGRRLVVQLPCDVLLDPAGGDGSQPRCPEDVAALLYRLREESLEAACDGVTADHGPHDVERIVAPEAGPRTVVLAASLVHGAGSPPLAERIEAVVAVCRSGDCRTVATGVRTEDEAETCRRLGCTLALGEHFGHCDASDATGASPAE